MSIDGMKHLLPWMGPEWLEWVGRSVSQGYGLLPETEKIRADDMGWWLTSHMAKNPDWWLPPGVDGMWLVSEHEPALIGTSAGIDKEGACDILLIVRKDYVLDGAMHKVVTNQSAAEADDEHTRLMRFFFGCGPTDPSRLPPSPAASATWPDEDDCW